MVLKVAILGGVSTGCPNGLHACCSWPFHLLFLVHQATYELETAVIEQPERLNATLCQSAVEDTPLSTAVLALEPFVTRKTLQDQMGTHVYVHNRLYGA